MTFKLLLYTYPSVYVKLCHYLCSVVLLYTKINTHATSLSDRQITIHAFARIVFLTFILSIFKLALHFKFPHQYSNAKRVF